MFKGIILAITALIASVCLPYSYETGGIKTEKELNAYVKIQPDLGWKWNTKYPTKFDIKVKGKKYDKGYKLTNFANGSITMKYFGAKDSINNLTIIASFSLCTPTTCRVFRNEEFIINFEGK